MKVWLGDRAITLDPAAVIGQGGEAEVYDLGDGRVLKIFKAPDHPDLASQPAEQQSAAARLAAHQDKLRALPALPARVVAPVELATRRKRAGEIVGYAMARVDGEPLYRFAEPRWRRDAAVGADLVVPLLRDLYATVELLHRGGVVIGDFNDTNVLCADGRAHLIDADSFQWGRWRCPMFTERFVDPRLCDRAASAPVLIQPHDRDSDWFAFATMVFRSLLLVSPYGGVFTPRDPARRIAQAARALLGITVFDAEVVYPRAAVPWSVLPDELIGWFREVFAGNRRGAMPAALLERLRFRRCSCGAEHARTACPVCRTSVPVVATVRGTVRAIEIAASALVATSWTIGRRPIAGAPAVWLDGGTLWRQGTLGPEAIGQVLAGLTRAWVGASLGVGLYRAGAYTVGFVFDPRRRGLIDSVKLPRIRGQLLDVHGVVGGDRAWLAWRELHNGREACHVAAISPRGELLGHAEAPADDSGWLGNIRGALAAGPILLVPTDDGVVRVEVVNGGLEITRRFPDTADLVTASDELFAAHGGLDVRKGDRVLRLTLS